MGIAIEMCDLLFAVDSIPAAFAVTNDPLVVYTSSIAAIVGLRSMYQLLVVALQDLVFLEKAVAVVLGFVGFKLVADVAGFGLSPAVSFATMCSIIAGSCALSLLQH